MTETRDYRLEMDELITKQLDLHGGVDSDAFRDALEAEVRKDGDLLDFLTHVRLRQVIAEWMNERRRAERYCSRDANQEVLDRIQHGGGSTNAPAMAARMIRSLPNGRDILTKIWAARSYGDMQVRDWIPSKLRSYIGARTRAMNTERSELEILTKLCRLCEVAGAGDLPIGDTLTDDQIEKVAHGQDIEIKPHRLRGSRSRVSAQAH